MSDDSLVQPSPLTEVPSCASNKTTNLQTKCQFMSGYKSMLRRPGSIDNRMILPDAYWAGEALGRKHLDAALKAADAVSQEPK